MGNVSHDDAIMDWPLLMGSMMGNYNETFYSVTCMKSNYHKPGYSVTCLPAWQSHVRLDPLGAASNDAVPTAADEDIRLVIDGCQDPPHHRMGQWWHHPSSAGTIYIYIYIYRERQYKWKCLLPVSRAINDSNQLKTQNDVIKMAE